MQPSRKAGTMSCPTTVLTQYHYNIKNGRRWKSHGKRRRITCALFVRGEDQKTVVCQKVPELHDVQSESAAVNGGDQTLRGGWGEAG